MSTIKILTTNQGNGHAQQLELALHSRPVLGKERENNRNNPQSSFSHACSLSFEYIKRMVSATLSSAHP